MNCLKNNGLWKVKKATVKDKKQYKKSTGLNLELDKIWTLNKKGQKLYEKFYLISS